MKKINNIIINCIKRWPVVAIYVIGALLLRETHPFSFYPMYNSFPNWSYVFYITDSENKIVRPSVFHKNSGDFVHLFCTICENKKIIYGNGVESKKELETVSELLFNTLALQNKAFVKTHPLLKIHRIYFFYKNGTIQTLNQVIYESHL